MAAIEGGKHARGPNTADEPEPKKQKGDAVVHQPPEEVAGFVRTLFTLLRVCDPSVVAWSEDGACMLIHDPARFAGEICPKFFRHRNFNSFTRLLNMYQFHKVPGNGRDKAVTFVHPSFRRGREDLLSKIQRKGSSHEGKADDETLAKRRKEQAERKERRDAERERQRAEKRASKDSSKARRAPAIFPSAAHYRAAAGTPEALIGRDVWERTNAEINELEKRSGYLSQSTVGGSSAVSTWMRRVVELEKEARTLKAENDRLRGVEQEVAQLRSQVQSQSDLIAQFQVDLPAQHSSDAAAKMTAALLDNDALCWDDADAPPEQHMLQNMLANLHNQQNQDIDPSLVQFMQHALQHHQHHKEEAPPADVFTNPDLVHLGMQQHAFGEPAPAPASQKQQPPLDMTTLINEPFIAECAAQCLASCGSLPSV